MKTHGLLAKQLFALTLEESREAWAKQKAFAYDLKAALSGDTSTATARILRFMKPKTDNSWLASLLRNPIALLINDMVTRSHEQIQALTKILLNSVSVPPEPSAPKIVHIAFADATAPEIIVNLAEPVFVSAAFANALQNVADNKQMQLERRIEGSFIGPELPETVELLTAFNAGRISSEKLTNELIGSDVVFHRDIPGGVAYCPQFVNRVSENFRDVTGVERATPIYTFRLAAEVTSPAYEHKEATGEFLPIPVCTR